jgi:hypothetical protein
VQTRTDCQVPADARGSLLDVRAGATADKVKWRWGSGSGIVAGDVGDPRLTADYALCVYEDAGGSDALVWDDTLDALGACTKRPCWDKTEKVGGPQFTYVDRPAKKSKVKAKVRAGAGSRGKISLKGTGPELALPTLGLTLPVRAEFRSSTGACWAATYDTGVLVNDPTVFRAKGGP